MKIMLHQAPVVNSVFIYNPIKRDNVCDIRTFFIKNLEDLDGYHHRWYDFPILSSDITLFEFYDEV
jgi:hypothetical protein